MSVEIEGIGTLTNPVAQGMTTRVRFCPSPTGNPHVGLVRTCLFNWAYARHVGGTFVFRVEDTDAARDSQQSYDDLLAALRWLGMDWDEGPEVGGPYGPYRQSERGDIYRVIIKKLVDAGHVYESFSNAGRDRGASRRGGTQREARLRQLRPHVERRAEAGVPRRGPRAGVAGAYAGRRHHLDRRGARRRHLRCGIGARLRRRARERRSALHAGESRRRRPHEDHPRATRRGPASVDATTDRALSRA